MWVPARIAELDRSPTLTTELAPLFTVYAPLNDRFKAADARIAAVAVSDPIVARLAMAPAVGPEAASAFVATLGDITRFRSAHELEVSLGLVPSEGSSGKKRQLGRITKANTQRVRWLLVEGARQMLRSKSPSTAARRACALTVPNGAASASPLSGSGAGWPASCTRCGGTACRACAPDSAARQYRCLPTRGLSQPDRA